MSDIWGTASVNAGDRKEEPVEFWNARERNLFGNKFKRPVLCKLNGEDISKYVWGVYRFSDDTTDLYLYVLNDTGLPFVNSKNQIVTEMKRVPSVSVEISPC